MQAALETVEAPAILEALATPEELVRVTLYLRKWGSAIASSQLQHLRHENPRQRCFHTLDYILSSVVCHPISLHMSLTFSTCTGGTGGTGATGVTGKTGSTGNIS